MSEEFTVSVMRSGARGRHWVDGVMVEEFFVPGRWAHLDWSRWCDGRMVEPVPGVAGPVMVGAIRSECVWCHKGVRLVPYDD